MKKYVLFVMIMTVTCLLFINVRAENTEYEINLDVDMIYAKTGSVFVYEPVVRSGENELEAKLVWSEGALDSMGRLAPSKHTLTVIVNDGSEKAVKTVAFVVGQSHRFPVPDRDDSAIDPEALYDRENGILIYVCTGVLVAAAAVLVIAAVRKRYCLKRDRIKNG